MRALTAFFLYGALSAQSPEEKARISFERARAALEEEDFSEALEQFESVIDTLGPVPEVVYNAARAARMSGQIIRADQLVKACFDAADASFKKSPEYAQLFVLAAEIEDLKPTYELVRGLSSLVTPVAVRSLLAAGADPNGLPPSELEHFPKDRYFLPLHGAIATHNKESLVLLVRHGAEPALRYPDLISPVEFAARTGAEWAIEAFGAAGFGKDRGVWELALMEAELNGHWTVAAALAAVGVRPEEYRASLLLDELPYNTLLGEAKEYFQLALESAVDRRFFVYKVVTSAGPASQRLEILSMLKEAGIPAESEDLLTALRQNEVSYEIVESFLGMGLRASVSPHNLDDRTFCSQPELVRLIGRYGLWEDAEFSKRLFKRVRETCPGTAEAAIRAYKDRTYP